jgi:uncharacterized protein YndB with AHSA1/START domain
MAVSHVANSSTFTVTTPTDLEIVITRVFDASPALVFEAMTKPEHVRRWWGILDDKHSVVKCEIDLRPGGAWHFVGRGPQGDAGFHGVYREIVAPERLVYTEIFDPYPDVESVITQILTSQKGKTLMTVSCVYPSQDVRDMVIGTGMEKGAALSYDRLEEVATELGRR